MTDALLARARARLVALNLKDGMPRIDAEHAADAILEKPNVLAAIEAEADRRATPEYRARRDTSDSRGIR